ncbi:hypothetical protein L6452_16974 [Arctium lappa]|uniref:Uncharacterized protein n=1 Tax=Arctium lappa TaxID=4217 RepID=A0ACB9C2B1_ARCLA|nr:hypothetical protein L6452_16974 [Arctium lappa]
MFFCVPSLADKSGAYTRSQCTIPKLPLHFPNPKRFKGFCLVSFGCEELYWVFAVQDKIQLRFQFVWEKEIVLTIFDYYEEFI